MNRRKFIKEGALLSSLAPLMSRTYAFAPTEKRAPSSIIRFGMIADVHKDLMPDADDRLEKFISAASGGSVDFIIQLGDFCHPLKENEGFLSIWNQFEGPKHHVLGNHDMDKGTKSEATSFWGMEAPYYSFDHGGVHFVILDANYLYRGGQFIDYANSNFYVDSSLRTFINNEQIEWVANDIAQTDLPVVVFSHQSLLHYFWGIKNRMALQEIFENANREAGYQKVIACFNGHDHIDFHREINGVHYIEVNSASYYWNEEAPSRKRYPAEYYTQYPMLENMATYQDPLYAFITIDMKGSLVVEGINSQWMAPDPREAGTPEHVFGSPYSPNISDRNIKFESNG